MRIHKAVPIWSIGVVLTMLMVGILVTGPHNRIDSLELKTYNLLARLSASTEKNRDIELVAITDDDLRELGGFPWPRSIFAQGIYNLSLAGAKVIVFTTPLSEPQESAGLKTIRRLKEQYDGLGLAQQGPGLSFYQELSQAERELDTDAKLYTAIKEAGNVVIPIVFSATNGEDAQGTPEFIPTYAYKKIQGQSSEKSAGLLYRFTQIKPLHSMFTEVVAGIGHMTFFPDKDEYLRNDNHVVRYLSDIYVPSLPIAVVKVFKQLKDDDISVFLGKNIIIQTSPSQRISIPAFDAEMSTRIYWQAGNNTAFQRTSFSKVFNNEFQTSLFRDKIVIIGPTALGVEQQWKTPVAESMPRIEIVANSVANILTGNFLQRPSWCFILEVALVIIAGIFLTFVMPRVTIKMGLVAIVAMLLGYCVIGTLLFMSLRIWVKVSLPLLLICVGYVLVLAHHIVRVYENRKIVDADSLETNKMLGLSFQQQGMLDLALEKFQKIPLSVPGAKDLLYNLGLDFDGKGNSAAALTVYHLILRDGRAFKDLSERISKLNGTEKTIIMESSEERPLQSSDVSCIPETPSTLGRYKIMKELGRGAMGVVYHGEDPKILRTVAIKTICLSDFDEDSVEEMRERFFREAQSAGSLLHSNIVTIYDVGEENDLAFIAMEFLEGEDLDAYTKPESLLPLRDVLLLIAAVAEALDFAHSRGIVHRDIKPANIMRLRGSHIVKVTDFGIARITASSKTKTGVILGTPSYMSPEQVGGKKVDGRSDIFSLGVVLFEMLTGHKPFSGEDMTSLLYQIARKQHPSPRSINPFIPLIIEKIIDKAMEKDPEKRYQRAHQMKQHLKRVVAKIDEIQEQRRVEG